MSDGSILQIVPQPPGTLDGVGDYALNLARALSARHDRRTVFLVARKTSAEAIDGFEVISGLRAGRVARSLAQRCDHVILHYVNYGYQCAESPFLCAGSPGNCANKYEAAG